MNTTPFPSRISLRTILRFLLAAVLLALLLRFIEPARMAAAFAEADLFLICLAFALVVFNLGIQILKWRSLLRDSGYSFPLTKVTQSVLFGISIGTLTPGQIGEFGGRAVLLQTDPQRIVGLTIIDKLQVLCVMTLGGIAALAVLFSFDTLLSLAALAGALAVLAVLLRPGTATDWIHRRLFRDIKSTWIQEFFLAARTLRGGKVILTTTLLTLAFYAVLWIQVHVLLNAFHPVSALDSFLGFAATMFVKSFLPFTIADLGIREAGLVYFLSLRAVPEPVALNASLLLFAINILLPSIVGLLFIPESISMKSTP
ncbi:MAG: hypothetical protein HBSIN02_21900 [Bacteroidia bacterium]|nr:MAG: hypothetical protein HBSIN02_21900 [Bacteroidia bacterium]